MTDVITYSMGLTTEDGPSLETSDHFDAESYSKLEVEIPKNSVPTTVNVQPSPLTQIQAIKIIAESYADLTYTVDEGVTVKTLDGPLMLVGPANIGDHFGATLNDLIFTNANVTVDNLVTILLARTAIEAGT